MHEAKQDVRLDVQAHVYGLGRKGSVVHVQIVPESAAYPDQPHPIRTSDAQHTHQCIAPFVQRSAAHPVPVTSH